MNQFLLLMKYDFWLAVLRSLSSSAVSLRVTALVLDFDQDC